MEKHRSKVLDNYTITLETDNDNYKDMLEGIRSVIEGSIESSGTINSDNFGYILKLNLESFWRDDGARYPWDCLVNWERFMNVTTGIKIIIAVKNFVELKHDFIKFIITKKI